MPVHLFRNKIICYTAKGHRSYNGVMDLKTPVPPSLLSRPWQAIIVSPKYRQICMDRGAWPSGLILGTLVAIAKLKLESPAGT